MKIAFDPNTTVDWQGTIKKYAAAAASGKFSAWDFVAVCCVEEEHEAFPRMKEMADISSEVMPIRILWPRSDDGDLDNLNVPKFFLHTGCGHPLLETTDLDAVEWENDE